MRLFKKAVWELCSSNKKQGLEDLCPQSPALDMKPIRG